MRRWMQATSGLESLGTLPWRVTARRLGIVAEPPALAPDLTGLASSFAADWRAAASAADLQGVDHGATSLPLLGRVAWQVPDSWSVDPVSGYDFGMGMSSDIGAVPDVPGADLLRAWVRGRLDEAAHAALHASLAGDGESARFAADIVADFMRRNPVGKGPQWCTAMEAGLRAVRLLHAAALLRDVGDEMPAARRALPVLADALGAHEAFLASRSDWRLHRTGNHHLVALAAWFLLQARLPPTASRAAEARRSWRAFWSELVRQVGMDGLHFESSTAYHALVAEAAAHVLVAGRRRGLHVPAVARERLLLCASALGALVRPDGSSPRIGDSDDGRFLDLLPSSEPAASMGAAVAASILAVALPHPGARGQAVAATARIHVALLLGRTGLSTLAGLPPVAPRSRCFPDGGVTVLVTPGPPLTHVVVSSTGEGRGGSGGHGHDDAGSYEYFRERPVVVDRGTGSYTGDVAMRDRYRGAASHSVVQVDGRDQNATVPGRPFRRGVRALPFVTRFEAEGLVEIGHHGYMVPPGRVSVLRRLVLEETGVLDVVDDVRGAGVHDVVLRIHWAPDLVEAAPPRDDVSAITMTSGSGDAVTVVVEATDSRGRRLSVTVRNVTWPHSPRQGVERPALTLEARLRTELPLRLRHRLLPGGSRGRMT